MNPMDDYYYGPFGDSATNPDAAFLDRTLRGLLTNIPDPYPTDAAVPTDMAARIHAAVLSAWPDGRPPTPDELSAEDAGHESQW
jgi:hypothetical protein